MKSESTIRRKNFGISNMKEIFFLILILILSIRGVSQHYIQGSIQKGAADNQVDITFLPDFDSQTGEAANYISFAIAIDSSLTSGMTPTLTMTGTFSGISMVHAIPFSYTSGSERTYTWVYSSGPWSGMSWSNGVEFVGATITFTGGAYSANVRLVDFTNHSPSGGTNQNTLFIVVTNHNPFDCTNYSDFFYEISDPNGSTKGTYGNGDQYVETNAEINLFSDEYLSKPEIMIIPTTVRNDISNERVFPNPAHTDALLIVNVPAKDLLAITVTDMNGRIVSQSTAIVDNGENRIPIRLSKLVNSTYMVIVVGHKFKASKVFKIVKQ